MATRAEVDVGSVPEDRDLGDHLLDGVDLDGALLQDAPDLVDQLRHDVLVADAVRDVAHDGAADLAQAALAFTLGLARRAEQQAEVQGQHLGEVVLGGLRGKALVQVVPDGDGQHAQFADGLEDHDVGIVAGQRGRRHGRVEDLRLFPVGPGEQPGGLHGDGARLDGGRAAVGGQDALGGVEDRPQPGQLREGGCLGQALDGVVESFRQTVQVLPGATVVVGIVHANSLRVCCAVKRPVTATRRSPGPPGA